MRAVLFVAWVCLVSFAVAQAPTQPISLTVTNVNSTSITLSWQQTGGGIPQTYILYQNGTNVATVDATITTYSFGGLSAGASYLLGVVASNADGQSATAAVAASTLGTPQSLSATNVLSYSLTATWLPPSSFGTNGTPLGYNLYLNGSVLANFTTTTSFNLSGLQPGTKYNFTVAAVTQFGEGQPSAGFSATTWSALSPPFGSGISNVKSSSVNIAWSLPAVVGVPGPGTLSSFNAHINGTLYQSSISSTARSLTFLGLSPGLTYSLSVVGVVSGSSGGETAPFVREVTTVGVPTNLYATNVTSHTANIYWSPPINGTNSVVLGYYVYLNNSQVATLDSSTLWFSIGNLTAGRVYSFTVAGYIMSGLSVQAAGSSAPLIVNTLGFPTLGVTNTLSTSYTLTWTVTPSQLGTNSTLAGFLVYQDGSLVLTPPSNQFSQSFSGFGPLERHNWTVAIVNNWGVGGQSKNLTVTTMGLVQNPTACALTNSATLSWTAPTTPGTNATVLSYSTTVVGPDFSSGQVASVGASPNVTISGLRPYSNYTASVSPVNSYGAGEPFSFNFTTLGVPYNLQISNVTSYSLSLSWSFDFDQLPSATFTVYLAPGSLPSLNATQASKIWTLPADTLATSISDATVLQAGEDYTLAVAVSGSCGQGEPSSVVTVTMMGLVTIQPPACVNSTSFSVTWSPPTSPGSNQTVTGYTIWLDQILVTTVTADTLTYSFSGLTPATSFVVTVAPMNEAGVGNSSSVTVQTMGVPSNLACTTSLSTTLTLTWSPPSTWAGMTPAGYRVYVNGSALPTLATSTPFVVTNLQPGSNFNLSVAAVSSCGAESDQSGVYSATTLGVPTGLTPSQVQSTSVTLSWQAPKKLGTNAILLGYSLYQDGQTPAFSTPGSNMLQTTALRLTGGVTYSFQISARNTFGEGSWSAPLLVTTLGPPRQVNVTQCGKSSVTINWQAPISPGTASNLTFYTIYKGPLSLGTVPATQTSYAVQGLTSGSAYTFFVSATNSWNAQSDKILVTANTLGPVTNLASTMVGSAVTLTWQLPAFNGSNANIVGYKIYVDGNPAILPSGQQLVTSLSVTLSSDFKAMRTYSLGVSAVNSWGMESDIATTSVTITMTDFFVYLTIAGFLAGSILLVAIMLRASLEDGHKNWEELMFTLLTGFLGTHKFLRGEYKMGIVYLLTGGLLLVGWVRDIGKIVSKCHKEGLRARAMTPKDDEEDQRNLTMDD